jgi:hypothetical protein
MHASQRAAIDRSRRLKAAETQYRKTKGVHPAYPWSEWSDRPRAGALWSFTEITALTSSIKELTNVGDKVRKLNVADLCELAWRHGRSANGVYEKLQDLLGRQFYRIMEYI